MMYFFHCQSPSFLRMTKQKNTIGAYQRTRYRNMKYGYGVLVSGPAVTPVGSDNSDLSLRFGDFPQLSPPRRIVLNRRFSVFLGAGARDYTSLSDLHFSSVSPFDWFSLAWSRYGF